MDKSEVVFSGRFDPPHPGHLATVKRLLKKFGYVNIVILDYLERDYPLNYVKGIFREMFEGSQVNVMANRTHFGEMTKDEWDGFKADYYAAGNLKVLRHMERIGANCYYVERAYEYTASDYKRLE